MTVEAGIAGVLRGLGDLRVSEGQPDTVNTDVAIIEGPLTYEDNDIAGCHVNQTYEITLLFSLASGISRARQRVMEYLQPSGVKSIRAALYANPTLNGEAQAFIWRGITSPPGRIQQFGKGLEMEVPVNEFYGAAVQIEVVV
jgi:hypothetical protein